MKTRYKRLIIFGVIFVILFSAFVALKITYYETWGDNEEWYHHPHGYKVECEFKLFGNPGSCIAIHERIMEAKRGTSDWGKVWGGPTPFGYHHNQEQCQNNGNVWYAPNNNCLLISKGEFRMSKNEN